MLRSAEIYRAPSSFLRKEIRHPSLGPSHKQIRSILLQRGLPENQLRLLLSKQRKQLRSSNQQLSLEVWRQLWET